ncbi:hypothetical protein HDU93_005571 [Gonapodya sp. JEL0774]|nr:hypothetical protein HDU93_005571 [Gonapodya sp. JEL0774]
MPISRESPSARHTRSTSEPLSPSKTNDVEKRPRQRIATENPGSTGSSAVKQPLVKGKSKHEIEDERLIKAAKENRRATFKVEGRRKAVLIGINYTGQGKAELKGCWNDVQNIRSFISSPPFSFPTDEDNMRVLTDDPSKQPERRPTRRNILEALKWLVEDVADGDSRFLHFSGHGVQREDTDGDEEDGFDESILPLDYTTQGPILDDELNRILVRSIPPTARLTCIFDSCHSGTVLDLPFCYSSTGDLQLYNPEEEAKINAQEAVDCTLRGDTKGAVGNLVAGIMAVTGEGDKAARAARKAKSSRGDVILFSGSKDDQTSADAKIDGSASGALSYAIIKTSRDYGVIAYGNKPGGAKISYAVLLANMRGILRDKFSQKVQLSSGKLPSLDIVNTTRLCLNRSSLSRRVAPFSPTVIFGRALSGSTSFKIKCAHNVPDRSNLRGQHMMRSFSSLPDVRDEHSSGKRYSRFGTAALGLTLGTTLFLAFQNAEIEAKAAKDDFARAVCYAVRMGDVAELSKLMKDKNFDPNLRHPFGWTPLHVACKYICLQGADPNALDSYSGPNASQHVGFEMLFELLRARQQEFTTYLDPRASVQGFTPLHYAAVNASPELVRILLENGADPSVKDSEGRAPRDYIDEDDYPALYKAFTEAEEHAVEEKRRREKEMRRKFPLESQLRQHIIGQDGPINAVASAIRRRENGWHDEEHPLVFLFLGSSGIGKTELAKQLAAYIHKDNLKKGFIRMDMSEFQTKHEVSKFIGSPPGYVGYEEGGQLTQKLTQCPNAVVLLDEVEKAHPDVLTVMLQLFDEGRITDGKGTTVECKDAIFVMTSNLAQQEIAAESVELRKDAESSKVPWKKTLSREFVDTTIYPILRRHFRRDEFLGRINDILYFVPFDDDELKRLVELELQRWSAKSETRHKIKLSWTPEVVDALKEEYNISYGARSIKHGVEKQVVSQIARLHEYDEIGDGSTVHLYVEQSPGSGNEKSSAGGEVGRQIRLKTTKPAASKTGGLTGLVSGWFGSGAGDGKEKVHIESSPGSEKRGGAGGEVPRIIEIK